MAARSPRTAPSVSDTRDETWAGRPLNEPTYMRVKSAIVADLLSGRFHPGDHLTIEMLTSRYAVSHMPIREALRQLEGEGVLVSLAHRGFKIEAISDSYIRNIYDIRVGLESMLARRSTERRTARDVEEVAALQARYRKEVEAGDNVAAVQLNILFHQRLYAPAQNLEAERLLDGRTRVVRTMASSLDLTHPQNRHPIIAEHDLIVSAFADGDVERCGKAVFDHVTNARDRLLNRLASDAVDLVSRKSGP